MLPVKTSSLASQLPQGPLQPTDIWFGTIHCGSWLASDEAGSVYRAFLHPSNNASTNAIAALAAVCRIGTFLNPESSPDGTDPLVA